MTLIDIVQRHCRRTGLSVPSIVTSSSEAQILQCWELLNEELDELSQRQKWVILQKEATWTSLSGADQGALRSLAPGIIHDWIVEDTVYNRSAGRKLYGPLSAKEYAAKQAAASAVTDTWRIVGGQFMLDSGTAAGETYAFEYYTNKAVVASDGTKKQYFTLDDDEPLLDSVVVLAGLRWRWKREQGLSYDEDFSRYEGLIANLASRQGGKPILDGAKEKGFVLAMPSSPAGG